MKKIHLYQAYPGTRYSPFLRDFLQLLDIRAIVQSILANFTYTHAV
jgi:hypothetical protein